MQRALTLPTSTEESQGLLDVSYGDDTSNYNLNTGNMKNICMMMKSPMRVTPPSFPSIIDCEEVNSARCNFRVIQSRLCARSTLTIIVACVGANILFCIIQLIVVCYR